MSVIFVTQKKMIKQLEIKIIEIIITTHNKYNNHIYTIQY